jgi:hypothetical protein
VFPGPIWVQSLLRYHSPELTQRLHELTEKYKELPRILSTIALYWVNGERTLGEIIELVELETGICASDYIAAYFEVLADLDGVEWTDSNRNAIP